MGKWFLIVLSIGLVVMGVDEYRLRTAADAEPQTLTCQQLADNGPGDNVNVTLTDYLLCTWSYAIETRGSTASKAWVPAVPLRGAYHDSVRKFAEKNPDATPPAPKKLRVLILFDGEAGENAIERVAQADELTGMVVNKIEKLDEGEKLILKKSYPLVDFDRCWIVEVDRKRASLMMVMGLVGGGIAVFAWAIYLFKARAAEKRDLREHRARS